MKELEPLGQRVIVRRTSAQEAKGLIVPKDTQKRSLEGVVVACGPEAKWVKEGDTVMWGQFSGFELRLKTPLLDDEYDDCLLMNCEDILAKIKEKNGDSPAFGN